MSAQVVLNFTPAQASREAAESITLSKKAQSQRILRYLESRSDGATCDEAEQDLNISHQSCSMRFCELKGEQLIEPIGKRPTRSGRNAVVYRVTGGEGVMAWETIDSA